jgi:diaminohydroxyphosphoribosylaminopyrimidine deaminase/5-amino-6-(5-phosphoribosylamino)uracil reductase
MTARASRSDEDFMREALRLARRTAIPPYPNPWVGSVVVRNGTIVGRGFHRGAGRNHAEVEALTQAGDHARGATLFVNLEPCCHYGRTPPCTHAILAAGIRRVVFPFRDPNPEVAGRGAAALKRRGVEVTEGIGAKEATALNEVYLKYRATALPFVTVKTATSLDGKIATRAGQSQWITDDAARLYARRLRARHQAVLVGINTILADDPHLGPRIPGASDPWRVVLDSKLRIPPRSRVLKTGRCIVAGSRAASARHQQELERLGARVWRFPGARVPLAALLRRLAAEGTLAVMVEGGSEVLGSFFDQRLVDRVYWFMAPLILGSDRSRSAVGGKGVESLADAWRLEHPSVRRVGGCWLIRGNVSPWALADGSLP